MGTNDQMTLTGSQENNSGLILLKGATYGGMHESPSSVPPLICICITMYGAVPSRLTRCARYCGSDV